MCSASFRAGKRRFSRRLQASYADSCPPLVAAGTAKRILPGFGVICRQGTVGFEALPPGGRRRDAGGRGGKSRGGGGSGGAAGRRIPVHPRPRRKRRIDAVGTRSPGSAMRRWRAVPRSRFAAGVSNNATLRRRPRVGRFRGRRRTRVEFFAFLGPLDTEKRPAPIGASICDGARRLIACGRASMGIPPALGRRAGLDGFFLGVDPISRCNAGNALPAVHQHGTAINRR